MSPGCFFGGFFKSDDCCFFIFFIFIFFLCRPKTGDSSSDEEAKEVSAASCQERLQPVDSQQHPSPHTYRKSLRLSSNQIVSALLSIFFLSIFPFYNFNTYKHFYI